MNISFTHVILVILLILSVYYDSTQRKIPNKITMPAILIGVIWSTVNSGLDGFLFSVLGFLLGFAVFLIPYIFGGIGAGDVKLMAAIGALMGWRFTIVTGLSTAVTGGLLVVLYLFIKGGFKRIFTNAFGILLIPLFKSMYIVTDKDWFLMKQKYFEDHKSKAANEYIPYALAISVGTATVFIFELEQFIQF